MRERIFNKSLTFDTNSTSDESDVLKIKQPVTMNIILLQETIFMVILTMVPSLNITALFLCLGLHDCRGLLQRSTRTDWGHRPWNIVLLRTRRDSLHRFRGQSENSLRIYYERWKWLLYAWKIAIAVNNSLSLFVPIYVFLTNYRLGTVNSECFLDDFSLLDFKR